LPFHSVSKPDIVNLRKASAVALCCLLLSVPAAGQSSPSPSAPPQGSTDQPTTVTIRWDPVLLATSYDVQVSTSSGFQTLTTDLTGINSTAVEIADLSNETTYYWRVRAVVTFVPGAWSDAWNFTTRGVPTIHSVPLNAGWNMISSFIRPYITHLDTLTASILDNLVIIKNGNGQVYFPAVAKSFINWNHEDGYQVYMQAPDTLAIEGSEVVPQGHTMTLGPGWHLISYLRNDSLSVESALSSIATNIVIVKANDGRVYWPGFGINQIGFLKPGQGYQLYLSAASTLSYPANN